MSYERFTVQKYKWDKENNVWSYWAEMNGPTIGHALSEAEAVEALAKNLEGIAAAIRAGEIWFMRIGELKEDPIERNDSGQQEM